MMACVALLRVVRRRAVMVLSAVALEIVSAVVAAAVAITGSRNNKQRLRTMLCAPEINEETAAARSFITHY